MSSIMFLLASLLSCHTTVVVLHPASHDPIAGFVMNMNSTILGISAIPPNWIITIDDVKSEVVGHTNDPSGSLLTSVTVCDPIERVASGTIQIFKPDGIVSRPMTENDYTIERVPY